MLRRKIIADTMRLNASGLVVQGLGMLQSILLIKFLEPEILGLWVTALLVLNYANYASLGIEHGMALRLPYYRGRGETGKSVVASDSAYVAWSLLSLFCAGLVGLHATFGNHSAEMRFALGAIAIVIPLTQQHAFFSRWQTSVPVDFSVGMKVVMLQGVLSFAVVVPMAYVNGLRGALLGTILVNAVIALLWVRLSSFRFQKHMSLSALRELVHAGFPMLLLVIGGVLVQTVDRVVIIQELGSASLGYYAITGLGGNALYGFLSQAGSAMSPHIVEESGRNVGVPERLEKYLVRPTLLFAYVSAILLLFVAAAVPMLVRTFVPKYLPGVSAFYAFVPGFFFLAITLTAGNILALLMIERRQARVPVYLQAAVILIQAAGAILAVRVGIGLAGVAVASTLSYAVYGSAMLLLTARLVLSPAGRVAFFTEISLPFLIACIGGAILFWSTGFFVGSQPVLRGIADIAGASLLAALLVMTAVRRLSLADGIGALLSIARGRLAAGQHDA